MMRLLFAIALASPFIVPSFAVGASSASDEDREGAKLAAAAGARDYKIGEYAAALASFSEAYRLFPAPKLLFNIGQCHRYLGDHEKAIWAFESYLEEDPKTPQRAHVEELIARTRVEFETLRADERRRRDSEILEAAELEAATQRAAEAEAGRQAAERARLEAERDKATIVAQVAAGKDNEAHAYETWWFWTIVGGVVLAGATTAVVVSTRPEPEMILPTGALGVVDHRTR